MTHDQKPGEDGRRELAGGRIGNYRLLRRLGRGGFSTVYLARHLILQSRPPVALKRLLTPLDSPRARSLFLEEARLLEELRHPHILPLIDAGIDDEGFPYLVTLYAAGGSLRDRLRRASGRPLPLEEALAIVAQVGKALQYAHERGVVHRDLKPENVLFTDHGEALLADFGIAVLLGSRSLERASVSGTPAYMAPEQFRGQVSRQSDQYALACLMYELCTGHRVFEDQDALVLMYRHTQEEPRPPRVYNAHLPPPVEAAILRGLAKERSARYPDVLSFVRALHAFRPFGGPSPDLGATALMAGADEEAPLSPEDGPAADLEDDTGYDAPLWDAAPEEATLWRAGSHQDQGRTPLEPAAHYEELPPQTATVESGEGETLATRSLGTDWEWATPLSAGAAPAERALEADPSGLGEARYDHAPAAGEHWTPLAPGYGPARSRVAPGKGILEQQSGPALVSSPAAADGPSIIELPRPSRAASATRSRRLAPGTTQGRRSPYAGSQPAPGVATASLAASAPLQAAPPHARAGAAPGPRSKARLPRLASRALARPGLTALALLLAAALLLALTPLTLGLLSPSATVTIVPASHALQRTYTLSARVGAQADPARLLVPARLLSTPPQAQSRSVTASGHASTPGTRAQGVLTFYNGKLVSQTVPANTVIQDDQGIQFVTETNAVIPPGNPPQLGSVSVKAHAVLPGHAGNIPANDINTTCCSADKTIFVKNLVGFTGGQDPQSYTFVQQSDIDGAAEALQPALIQSARTAFAGLKTSSEESVGDPQCSPQVTSDHRAGDRASSVTVTVTVSCSGLVYDRNSVITLVTALLNAEIARSYGSGYSLAHPPIAAQISARAVSQTTAILTVRAGGTWSYRFSAARLNALKQLIAGREADSARAILRRQPGIADVILSLGLGQRSLPTDPARITIKTPA
uniref:non-specific serine/threonine protein kinase n=1 Tax=Thermogemmatispora argillosa TaxID=2045280 RepID=A0A455T969_9CHLR|nr:hypothetical protein KTA_41900 [Thermogemmatispora argillosa]